MLSPIRGWIEDAGIFLVVGAFIICTGLCFWVWSIFDRKGYRQFIGETLEDPYDDK